LGRKNVLQHALDDSALAVRFKLGEQAVAAKIVDCHARLLAARGQRVRPPVDNKVLSSWNGLLLRVLAEAARVLDDETKASEYLILATRSANFLLNNLYAHGKLHRSWHEEKTTREVFLEDYAALILGLLELYQADFDNRW